MCSEHSFAHNRFFCSFFLSFFFQTPIQTLSPLHYVTRIEAAKWHWRAHWACRLTLAHPGMRLVKDHPSRQLSPGCVGQFMTPTMQDCTVSKLLNPGVLHHCSLPTFTAAFLFFSFKIFIMATYVFPQLLLWLLCFRQSNHTSVVYIYTYYTVLFMLTTQNLLFIWMLLIHITF